jgi:hypothetical protein
MNSVSLVNKGASLRKGQTSTDDTTTGRTFIVSGSGRGGTTLVAEILREAGLHLGDNIAEIVSEDLQMLGILRSGDRGRLDTVIARRNGQHQDWGFKLPNIHAFLHHKDLARFRNPHLIMIFRDPQAIATRGVLADYFDPLIALRDASVALNNLVEFVHLTTCPCLLLSYEKALTFPGDFIDTLVNFCGLGIESESRQRLLGRVQPNAESYIAGARRFYAGVIDHLTNGTLFGWCREVDKLDTQELDLFINENKVLTFRADQFRADLADAGFGNGNHGFVVNLARFAPESDAVLKVRVSGCNFELQRSGRHVREYSLA